MRSHYVAPRIWRVRRRAPRVRPCLLRPRFRLQSNPRSPLSRGRFEPERFPFQKRISNRKSFPFRNWTSLLSKGFRTRMDAFLPDARRDGRTSGHAAKHCFDRRATCAMRICTSHVVPHASRVAVTGTCFVWERRSGSSSVSCQGLRLALAGSGSTPACPKIRPRGSLASDWWIPDVQERSITAWKMRLVSTSTHDGQAGKGSDVRQAAVALGRWRAADGEGRTLRTGQARLRTYVRTSASPTTFPASFTSEERRNDWFGETWSRKVSISALLHPSL